jgi:hypothetical protein
VQRLVYHAWTLPGTRDARALPQLDRGVYPLQFTGACPVCRKEAFSELPWAGEATCLSCNEPVRTAAHFLPCSNRRCSDVHGGRGARCAQCLAHLSGSANAFAAHMRVGNCAAHAFQCPFCSDSVALAPGCTRSDVLRVHVLQGECTRVSCSRCCRVGRWLPDIIACENMHTLCTRVREDALEARMLCQDRSDAARRAERALQRICHLAADVERWMTCPDSVNLVDDSGDAADHGPTAVATTAVGALPEQQTQDNLYSVLDIVFGGDGNGATSADPGVRRGANWEGLSAAFAEFMEREPENE